MKKIGLWMVLILVLTACSPRISTVEKAQNAIQATRTAKDVAQAGQIAMHSIGQIGNQPTFVLVVFVLFLIVPIAFAASLFFKSLALWRHRASQAGSGSWDSRSDALWDPSDEPDLTRQIPIDQHGVFSQLFAQGHEQMDQSDQSADWWS